MSKLIHNQCTCMHVSILLKLHSCSANEQYCVYVFIFSLFNSLLFSSETIIHLAEYCQIIPSTYSPRLQRIFVK